MRDSRGSRDSRITIDSDTIARDGQRRRWSLVFFLGIAFGIVFLTGFAVGRSTSVNVAESKLEAPNPPPPTLKAKGKGRTAAASRRELRRPPPPPPPPLLGSCPVRPIECPHGSRQSIIVITRAGQGVAGLYDRFVVLGGIAALASSLCARVLYSRPCAMLATEHYGGNAIPCDHGWERYLRIGNALKDDDDGGSSGRIGSDMLVDNNKQLSLERAISAGRAVAIGSRVPLVPYRHLRWGGSKEKVEAAMLREYELARSALERNQSFLWRLEHYYYLWAEGEAMKRAKIYDAAVVSSPFYFSAARFLHERLKCPGRVRVSYSDIVLRAQQLFASAAGDPSLRSTIVLHVRRGDMTKLCDASPSTISSYLQCGARIIPSPYSSAAVSSSRREEEQRGMTAAALGGDFPHGSRIVYFTAISSPTDAEQYIPELHKALTKTVGPTGHVIDGDALIASVLSQGFSSMLHSNSSSSLRDSPFAMAVRYSVMDAAPATLRIGFKGMCFCPPQPPSSGAGSSADAAFTPGFSGDQPCLNRTSAKGYCGHEMHLVKAVSEWYGAKNIQ